MKLVWLVRDFPEERMAVKVDPIKCPQDHVCPAMRVCPTGALQQKGFELPFADVETCTECGICIDYCPRGAIQLP